VRVLPSWLYQWYLGSDSGDVQMEELNRTSDELLKDMVSKWSMLNLMSNDQPIQGYKGTGTEPSYLLFICHKLQQIYNPAKTPPI
jgi:hypothetical protein